MIGKTLRTGSAALGTLAVIGMAMTTVACSPRAEKPAETAPTRTSAPSMSPNEKSGGYNPITRTPQSFSPSGGGSGPVSGPNAAVPCGFGNNQCKNNS